MQYNRLKVKNLFNAYKRWRSLSNNSYSSSIASQFKLDNSFLGYYVKKVENISELNLTAILLEHQATGAEHLHLACKDSNNLFGVSFRTTPTSSNGVPHILEHLALCGSQKFPCRDPFFNMLNRSLSTFMNAFTTPDSTMYAFSSQNKKDFQNLLSVYLDAAFYPLLNEKDFRQEGWRLEHENINDRNSPIVLKGVVFNEMKGVYSDPSSYYYYNLHKRLFSNSTYSHISGGDPLEIPTLSWEALKFFHSHHYHPTNSRFITYGNMPLESHLEFIEDNVLKHFQKLKIDNEVVDEAHWNKPREAHIFNKFDPLAAIPDKQTVISQSFLLDRITDTYESFALSILGTLLIDGPNAPFYQKLLESGIGPDFSPGTGYWSHLKQGVFSVGLREIAEKDVDHVKDVISSTFDEAVKTGFSDKRIEGVLHTVEMTTKHISTKFGLSCAMSVNAPWNHNGCPITALKVNDHVEWFTKQMKENKHFLQDKIVQYFKDNKHRLTFVMSPSETFEAEQKEQEKKLLETKLKGLTEDKKLHIYNEGIELSKHQKQVNNSCLPTLRIEDVKRTIEKTPIFFKNINQIPVQICEQPTNEIVYFRALINADNLSEDDIMLLPLFCSIITQMGTKLRTYKEFDQEVQLKTGSFNILFHLCESPSHPNEFSQNILFSSHCLQRNLKDMFELWKDIFHNVQLEDVDRLTQLIKLRASDMAQGVTHEGHMYAMRKASSTLSQCADVRERTAGLTQLAYMKKLSEMENHEETLQKLKNLATNFFNKKFLKCSINAMPSEMPHSFEVLKDFILDINNPDYSPTDGKKIINRNQAKNEKSHFVLPTSVNFLGQSILTVPYCHQDFASLMVAAKLLSSKFLHAEIREKGGAYGGGASLNQGGHFLFYSYRDPNVSKTLNSFSSGITWLLNGSYSTQDIDEAKLGVFSKIDAPVAPGSKGQTLFKEQISEEMIETLRLHILNCKKEDIIHAAERYLKSAKVMGTALIGPETKETTSENEAWTII